MRNKIIIFEKNAPKSFFNFCFNKFWFSKVTHHLQIRSAAGCVIAAAATASGNPPCCLHIRFSPWRHAMWRPGVPESTLQVPGWNQTLVRVGEQQLQFGTCMLAAGNLWHCRGAAGCLARVKTLSPLHDPSDLFLSLFYYIFNIIYFN